VIVRILGEGQYELDDEHVEKVGELDASMVAAIEADDQEAFAAVLKDVIAAVRASGTPVDAETIAPSTLTIPHEGATLAEVRELLAEENAGADDGEGAGAGNVAGDAGES
jgi:hypothetical protein